MKRVEIDTWTIDRIICSSWDKTKGFAQVFASNYAGDQLDFEVARHPDEYAVAYSIDPFFQSPELSVFDCEAIINENLIDEIYERLEVWSKSVAEICEDFRKSRITDPGLPIEDIFYARLAKLYQLRSEMGERAITERLASDMGVPISTAKERIRRARVLGFLTSPGKGGANQGKATAKAEKTLANQKKKGRK